LSCRTSRTKADAIAAKSDYLRYGFLARPRSSSFSALVTAMANLLFSINGRISRGPFWLVYLLLFAATAALVLFIETRASNNPVLVLIVLALHVWIAICVTVKRLHDIDASGWLSIPIVLIPIAVILVGSFPGTVGSNRYGPDPLERPSSKP
jgi:uncharacterized membrane protein YhaH (DUF805 family)